VGYHNPLMLTPNIDSLARSGVILEQNYVQPYCTPSRASLLTGMYPYHISRHVSVLQIDTPTGLTLGELDDALNDSTTALLLERELLSEALRDLGYSTHLIGK